MQLSIRQEVSGDYRKVAEVIETAFKTIPFSDHREHFLVERLRHSEAFIPALSLVAELNNEVVGHILLTKIKIKNEKESFVSLALAPVSVSPNHQHKGIGGQLILAAHKLAKDLGFKSIVLLGHENYYPRFGYKMAESFGIQFPFEVPKENCMVIELVQNGLKGVSGMVEYSKVFYE